MTHAPHRNPSFFHPVFPYRNNASESRSMSSRKFSQRRDTLTFRQHFAVVWQQFIVENFDSPAHAAHVFQVDYTTAGNWWTGRNAPSGWVVGRAIADPETRAAVLALLGAT